jgi:hypothetical protein
MPALAPVTKVLKVVIQQLLVDAATALINRLFFSYSGTTPTDSDLDGFSGAVAESWQTNMLPLQDDIVGLQGVQTEDLTSATSAVGSATSGDAGTRAGEAVPAGTAFVISSEIARRYRGGHPRTYLYVGVGADLEAAFRWGSAFISEVLTGWTNFIEGVEAGGWSGAGSLDPVNVSYFEGFTNHTYPSGRTRPIPTPRTPPITDDIVSYIGRASIGSQRRRHEFFD